MVTILKQFKIEIRAYHGGTLHGKDVRKLMNDASEIFTTFATILKDNKNVDCKYNDGGIDEMCKKYATLCVLWDGAFSYAASKKNPSEYDIIMYERIFTAAVSSFQVVFNSFKNRIPVSVNA